MQQDWNKIFGFAFPPFNLIGRVINKILWEYVETMILVTPIWQTQPWYTLLLRMSIQRSLLLLALPKLLLNHLGENHPLVKTRFLKLATWKITGKLWKWKEFQAMQPNLSPCPRRPCSIAGYQSTWNKWVSWCCWQQIGPVCVPLHVELFINTVWNRPTISNYKFILLCYFSIPWLYRWKACWETSWSLYFADRCVQSKATTTSLYIHLGCWNSFGLPENKYVW